MPDLSIDSIVIIIGMAANLAVMCLWFGRILGHVTAKLTDHEKRHIRHESRLDDHSKALDRHGRDLAVLVDRNARGASSV
jgi:uncharacterized membrane-anchored protein YhcB (DUF1043 family)